MSPESYLQLAERFVALHVAVLGDFCLDRYYEIDPARNESSIETGLKVHNVVRIRSQPGGAGTVINNLAALGVGKITPIGFCGDDGEGFELRRALLERSGVALACFLTTPLRHTFTYGKPLVMHPGRAPEELNRLDTKNWTTTPTVLEDQLISHLNAVAPHVDALIVLDQVDTADTGVVTRRVLDAVRDWSRRRPELLILADSRRGLRDYPSLIYKMNAHELAVMQSLESASSLEAVSAACAALARKTQRSVIATLAEQGIVGALPDGRLEHVAAWPTRGAIDIVGAGDSVTANLTASLAAGACLRDALEIGMAAASIVIHQIGTTGTATPSQIHALLANR